MARVVLPTLPEPEPLPEAVLFAFDRWALPYRSYTLMRLAAGRNPELVLSPGPAGSHDESLDYYGTVLRIGDTLYMWYWGCFGPELVQIGYGHRRTQFVLCLATSKDGLNWEKPDLGLVEFNGSKHNNIVDLPDARLLNTAGEVIYEPDDPDPERRFKLIYQGEMTEAEAARMEAVPHLGNRWGMFAAFSADGLRWRLHGPPVGPWFEMGGLTKFRGVYYCAGQDRLNAQHPMIARRFSIFASTDFVTWSPAAALALDRAANVLGPQYDADMCEGEEIHLGAGMHNRGNVVLGIYGQWHGTPEGDRRNISMDLGLAISHDGLHYHEPIPGFKFVRAREQPYSVFGDHPALMHGQGMENFGDRTLYWYSPWKGIHSTGVRVVSWPRDRFGWVQPTARFGAMAQSLPFGIVDGDEAPMFINAAGLGSEASLRIGLLNEGFHPLPGFSGADAAVVAESGLRVPVTWPGGRLLPANLGRLRLDIRFDGVRPEDARLYAIYIGGGS